MRRREQFTCAFVLSWFPDWDERKRSEKTSSNNIPLFEMLKLLTVSRSARLDPRFNIPLHTFEHRAWKVGISAPNALLKVLQCLWMCLIHLLFHVCLHKKKSSGARLGERRGNLRHIPNNFAPEFLYEELLHYNCGPFHSGWQVIPLCYTALFFFFFAGKLIISPSVQVSWSHTVRNNVKTNKRLNRSIFRINEHKVSFPRKPIMMYNL